MIAIFLLSIALFIAFVVGLINPSWILRWSKKPTRIKVFGWWCLTTFIVMYGDHSAQRAVWRNGGCGSLESTTKQQVKWLVASAGSPPLRQAATTLEASKFLRFSVRVSVEF